LVAAAGALGVGAIALEHDVVRGQQPGGGEKAKPQYGRRARGTPDGAHRALAHPHDFIRTVPPKLMGAPSHAAPAAGATPQLVYEGGPLLSAVEVVTVFWGQRWTRSPLKDTADKLNGYFDFILTSSLIDQLSEYSVSGMSIGQGRRTGSVTLTHPLPRRTVTDGALQHMIMNQIGSGGLPSPNQDTLYFVYLPPGVTSVMGGGASCSSYCGYHNDINGQVFYALMPYPDCDGCKGGLAEFDALTSTSSHELCEAITDPIPGQGWYDEVNGEIGDICAWKTKQVGSFTVQLEWSNAQGQCV
jgi:hypothetical protein